MMGQAWPVRQRTPDADSSSSDESSRSTDSRRRKRKRHHESDEEDPEVVTDWDTPRKKKVKTTPKYIYDSLFCDGFDSDITIVALGAEWNLHRFYLSQADYFASMFNGSWTEASQNRVVLTIVDENITVEALRTLFGSLYCGEVHLCPSTVVSVLAAARWFHFGGLLRQCEDLLLETLGTETLCTYYAAADLYNLEEVKTQCKTWLHFHTLITQSSVFLKELSPDLLKEILDSPDLFVLQVEMDIYTLLKQWLYLQLHQDYDQSFDKLPSMADAYFRSEGEKSGASFLERDVGQPYVECFRCIRLQHVLSEVSTCLALEKDRILPNDWIAAAYRHQWLRHVQIEQGKDSGPSKLSLDQFYREAMRCGRTLVVPQDRTGVCWRWVGFAYGVDMVLRYVGGKLSICRNREKYPRNNKSISLGEKRREVFLCLSAACLDDRGIPSFIIKTEPRAYHLAIDEEVELLRINQKITRPLYLSLHISFTGKVPA